MKKNILFMLLMISTNIYAQEISDDYLQDEINFENHYGGNISIQEQEELKYQYTEPNEYFLTEEDVYDEPTEYYD